jgi:hypothetical protein
VISLANLRQITVDGRSRFKIARFDWHALQTDARDRAELVRVAIANAPSTATTVALAQQHHSLVLDAQHLGGRARMVDLLRYVVEVGQVDHVGIPIARGQAWLVRASVGSRWRGALLALTELDDRRALIREHRGTYDLAELDKAAMLSSVEGGPEQLVAVRNAQLDELFRPDAAHEDRDAAIARLDLRRKVAKDFAEAVGERVLLAGLDYPDERTPAKAGALAVRPPLGSSPRLSREGGGALDPSRKLGADDTSTTEAAS